MTHTPWGEADSSRQIAVGIMEYTTPSHGGLHVSPSRLRQMPEPYRLWGGWYEEDCEWAMVAVSFPEFFSPHAVETALQMVKNVYPDKYEAVTGEIIPLAESYTKKERAFYAEHKDAYLCVCAYDHHRPTVPTEMVGVIACVGGDKSRGRKAFLVPEAEYSRPRNGLPFVVDPARHPQIESL